MDIVISKSDNKHKKFKAIIDGKKTVHFGAKGYDDFTTHKDQDRKDNYIARHKKEKIGLDQVLIRLDFTLNMCFGIKIL